MQSTPAENSQQSLSPALLAFCLVSSYVGFGRSRIYQLIADGDFPPPVKIGKSSRWLKTEIDCWLSKQAAARHPLVKE